MSTPSRRPRRRDRRPSRRGLPFVRPAVVRPQAAAGRARRWPPCWSRCWPTRRSRRTSRRRRSPPPDTFAQNTNLMWIVVGAALVMFMQAGFALLETGFVRAKNAGAHDGDEHRRVRHRRHRLLPGRLRVHVRRLLREGARLRLGLRPRHSAAPSSARGKWVFLWKGGWALTGGKFAASGAVLGFFLYMLAFMDTAATIPTGVDGRALEVQVVRALGLLLRRRSTTRCSAPGPGAAAGCRQLGNSWHLGPGLHRLRRLRRRARRRWRRRADRRHGARPPHRQVHQGRQVPRPARPQHGPGRRRHPDPDVRLVRVQRRVDPADRRRPVRARGRQHRHRRGARVHRAACSGCGSAPASPTRA